MIDTENTETEHVAKFGLGHTPDGLIVLSVSEGVVSATIIMGQAGAVELAENILKIVLKLNSEPSQLEIVH